MRLGQVIRNAKLWCDVESAAEAADLSAQWGITLVPGFTASKLAWLKKNEPGSWARLRHVLLPHDYLNHFLTGKFVMEVRTCAAARQSSASTGEPFSSVLAGCKTSPFAVEAFMFIAWYSLGRKQPRVEAHCMPVLVLASCSQCPARDRPRH